MPSRECKVVEPLDIIYMLIGNGAARVKQDTYFVWISSRRVARLSAPLPPQVHGPVFRVAWP